MKHKIPLEVIQLTSHLSDELQNDNRPATKEDIGALLMALATLMVAFNKRDDEDGTT